MSIERSKQLAALAPIIAAHAAGKVIQFRSITTSQWYDKPDPDWTARPEHYRVKPEPREWWINVYPTSHGGSAAHLSRAIAVKFSDPSRVECVHVKEVL